MFRACLATLVASAAVAWMAEAQAPGRPKRRDVELPIGSPAPDLTLADGDGKNPVTLSQLRGKPTILIFGSCT